MSTTIILTGARERQVKQYAKQKDLTVAEAAAKILDTGVKRLNSSLKSDRKRAAAPSKAQLRALDAIVKRDSLDHLGPALGACVRKGWLTEYGGGYLITKAGRKALKRGTK